MEGDPVREYGDELAAVTVARGPLPTRPADPVAATGRPVRAVLVAVGNDADTPAGVERVALAEDVGHGAAANRAIAGLDRAVGWVAVAEQGTVWSAGALDALLAAARRHPRAGALGPRLRDRHGRPLRSAGSLPTAGQLLRGEIGGRAPLGEGPVGWLSGSCLLLRRAAWDSVDGFDPRYPGDGPARPGRAVHREVQVADLDLGERLRRAGWLALYVPSAEARLDGGGGQGMLERRGSALRRYLRGRHPAPVRAAVAVGSRLRDATGR